MNDATSKPGARPVDAAVEVPSTPDRAHAASDVAPSGSAKSRLSFSSSLGCTDSPSSVLECQRAPIPPARKRLPGASLQTIELPSPEHQRVHQVQFEKVDDAKSKDLSQAPGTILINDNLSKNDTVKPTASARSLILNRNPNLNPNPNPKSL